MSCFLRATRLLATYFLEIKKARKGGVIEHLYDEQMARQGFIIQ